MSAHLKRMARWWNAVTQRQEVQAGRSGHVLLPPCSRRTNAFHLLNTTGAKGVGRADSLRCSRWRTASKNGTFFTVFSVSNRTLRDISFLLSHLFPLTFSSTSHGQKNRSSVRWPLTNNSVSALEKNNWKQMFVKLKLLLQSPTSHYIYLTLPDKGCGFFLHHCCLSAQNRGLQQITWWRHLATSSNFSAANGGFPSAKTWQRLPISWKH